MGPAGIAALALVRPVDVSRPLVVNRCACGAVLADEAVALHEETMTDVGRSGAHRRGCPSGGKSEAIGSVSTMRPSFVSDSSS